ncbi:hypothetical protein TVAG_203320 [Trichomonas vaginalis G3]|uniref:Uncharacterized protein n=1 Tax=Trichomonas vaginalis (strain ATCC PRA-98 / G3) TaxID=412133 RepID=A2FNG7_TRIV3|nr:La ribonucleoprotein domain family [Trichomonas vaginalis G3]EAX93541.1 hypothetical protein TVAG_203320 [Trichomonas vaginalis G3]KAI5503776.1 La ribonucleoprotein domain family [Trichomonas vaginalis G3]|eukprot:XP_001306471.1 hypothetical protein [Trichomonas vaginalis G3]
MSDWDVIGTPAAVASDDGYEEEEEWYDDDFNDYDDDFENQSEDEDYPYPPRITASSFQMPVIKISGSVGTKVRSNTRSKREDRLAYRHRTGAGIRKGLLTTGNDINESLRLYNEGYGSYNDCVLELREANAPELIPDYEKNKPEVPSGAGSKIINITRVKKGTLSKLRDGRNVSKDDVITQKIDLDPKHYWDHISHQLMEDGQFVQGKYDVFHDQAINERASLGIGNSAEMNSLYCFWCFYLREHYDEDMYHEFLRLAREDVAGGSHYGIECYFRFCSYGLEIRWDEKVFKDFENEAMEDHRRKSNYGLEKLQAFRVNQKHSFPIPFDPEIIKILDQYPTMKSFREQPKSQNSAKPKREKNAGTKLINSIKKEQPDPRREHPDSKKEDGETKNTHQRKEQPNPPKSQPVPPQKSQPKPSERKVQPNPPEKRERKPQPIPPEIKDRKGQPEKRERKQQPKPQPIPETNPNRGPQRFKKSDRIEPGSRIQPSSAPMDSLMRRKW